MSTRCRPGDLAVVIQAQFPSNLGRIVKVIEPHNAVGDLRYPASIGTAWLVESDRPLTWMLRGKRYRRKRGPVLDLLLQPIRGRGVDAAGETDRMPLEAAEEAQRAIAAVIQCRWHEIYSGCLWDAPGRNESWTEAVAYIRPNQWLLRILATDYLGFNQEPAQIESMTDEQVIDWVLERDFEDRESESYESGPRGEDDVDDDDVDPPPGERTVALLRASVRERAHGCVDLLGRRGVRQDASAGMPGNGRPGPASQGPASVARAHPRRRRS